MLVTICCLQLANWIKIPTFAEKTEHTVEEQRPKYSKPRFLICFAVVIGILAGISHLFGLSTLDVSEFEARRRVASAAEDEQSVAAAMQAVEDGTMVMDDEIEGDVDEEEDIEAEEDMDSVADVSGMVQPAVFTSTKVWSYSACFPDSNAVQMEAARRNGVMPMAGRGEVMTCVGQQQLSNISSSPYYVIDDLTHSMPYLVPKAQTLLNTIGINFVDSLYAKGMALHLPIVTSVLRTTEDIRRLQRGNSNSVTNSCHCYGTTIDITYNRFMPLDSQVPTRFDEGLKKVLAEVLYDLRADGRCYVKYERRQACFHLTVI